MGRRVRTRVCSHTNSTEAISFVDPGSISENLSENSSGKSSGDLLSVEDLLERTTEEGEINDPWEPCAGEKTQMEDCQERKCPGLWI